MRGFRLLRYCFVNAARSIRASWFLHSISIVTIATAFFILGGGYLVFQNLRSTLVGTKGATHLSVYLRDNVSTKVRKAVEAECGRELVQSCSYRSTAEAKTSFLKSNPELQSTVRSLRENPFPASVEIELNSEIRDRLAIKDFAQKLAVIPGVKMVDDGGEWLDRWMTLLRLLDWVMLFLALSLCTAMLFIVGNTIRLVVYARRNEIEILDLVGASNAVIRGPFLLEGFIQGLAGSTLALVLLRLFFALAQKTLMAEFGALLSSAFLFLSDPAQVFFVGSGGLLGVVGSAVAVRRFLRT